VTDRDSVARHLKAAETHDAMAARHEKSSIFWAENGDPERADLERRNAAIERDAAQLERDRAELERVNPVGSTAKGRRSAR
jgi:hypothetical protein